VSDRCSILLICKRWCFEINGNENWAEILQWFLRIHLLKSSSFHIVKFEIWAGLLSKDLKFKVSDRCSILLICKRWCFEINGNKNWAEILQWFLLIHLLKRSSFQIVKFEIWAGLLSKDLKYFKFKVSDRFSILLISKRWCFEINGNKNWAEILQWFLRIHLLKRSRFHIVKFEIWAG